MRYLVLICDGGSFTLMNSKRSSLLPPSQVSGHGDREGGTESLLKK